MCHRRGRGWRAKVCRRRAARRFAAATALALAACTLVPAAEGPGGVRVTSVVAEQAASRAAGAAVAILGPGLAEVHLPGGEGETGSAFLVDPSRRALPFGDAVALLPPVDHEPSAPFDIEIVSPDGQTRRHVAGAGLLSVDPEGRLLVVAWRLPGPDGGSFADVLDDHGKLLRTFRGHGAAPPRVAGGGGVLAAISPGVERSFVDLAFPGQGPTVPLTIDGAVMTGGSISRDGDGILVWGPREVAWIELNARRVAWRARMPGGERPLPSPGSRVTPVNDRIAVATRVETAGSAWTVDLLLLDARDGELVERLPLHRSAARPASVTRVPRGDGERLVFAERTYDLTPSGEGRP